MFKDKITVFTGQSGAGKSSLLNLLNPDKFKAYWPFVNSYCITIQTPFGKQIERNPRNIAEFRKMLDNYMVRRLKSEVLHDLPGKQRPLPSLPHPAAGTGTAAHRG